MRNRIGTVAAGVLSLATLLSCTTAALDEAPQSVASAQETDTISAPAWQPVDLASANYAPYVDNADFRVAYRRTPETLYRHTIADVFGPDIVINARFEPERREDGLQAIGNSRLSITTSGLEQYLSVARSIADQVFESDQRMALVGCSAEVDAVLARPCAETFIKARGRQLFRRPLSEAEIATRLELWEEGGGANDFDKGAKLALISLLMAPDFLFRVERAETDPDNPDGYRLDSYSKATRIAAMLWDTSPDEELLEAAEAGALHSPIGLQKQIDRMTSSPRMEDGVRAFFSDMLQYETFDVMTKDPVTYPKFSQAVADGAREETLRFLVDHLVSQNRDYRDIFTSQETFINRPLAAVYDVPFASMEEWTRYAFPEEAGRSGVLTQVSFLSLFSHPAASSPTIRGVHLHEIFLCLATPEPPADVDFSKVQALENGTVRTRLIDHMTNPGCNTCHAISDPAGLTLEHFDGLGQTRKYENDILIDVSAEIGGKTFEGAQGLGQYLHDSPLVPACVVRNMHYYGVGRPFDYADAQYLSAQTNAFVEGGHRFIDLYRNILADPEFFKVVVPEGVAPDLDIAQTSQISSGGGQ